MINPDNWEQQPGGLYLKVQPFDKENADHRVAAASIMYASVHSVAQTHGADFNEAGFQNNMKALYQGDIQLDLFLAKWEVCNPQFLCLGASLNWDTLGIDPYGQVVNAVYTEDVCILTSKLRNLIRQKPKGKDFPDESLAECFERLSLQNMRDRGVHYRFGEVDPENTKMMRSLDGNGAIIGIDSDSSVLELRRLPNDLADRFPVSIKITNITRKGVPDKRNFIASWKHGQHDMRFIVTQGQATAAGMPRADIRPWHNGNLPSQTVVDCVLASSLRAIRTKIEENGWNDNALLGLNPFGAPMPDAHVFVLKDKPILEAFSKLGASPRLFGDKMMMPGINQLTLF